MRILVLTFQYANNMGAQLQCYALARYLKETERVDCQVLNYLPSDTNVNWSIINKPKSIRDVLKIIYLICNVKLLVALIRKRKVMLRFVNKYIPLTEEYDRNRILKQPPTADAFICGSDQIWNFKYRCDLTYFFDFVDKSKSRIIAYAPSIADQWPLDKSEYIAPYLRRFDALSVRETANLSDLKRISPNNKPVVVCDPVFLLSKQQWDLVADYKLCPNEPYIFCYFLSVTPLAVSTVSKIRELTGLKVVHLNLNALDKLHSDFIIRVANPFDFVGLISKASYICTNSFHCSAFSILFRKNFMFIPKHMANDRIRNLIEVFRLSNVIINKEDIDSMKIEDLDVDYSSTTEVSKKFVDFSKHYLHSAIFE